MPNADFPNTTLFQRPDRLASPLFVICPVINASRFRSRWKHFQSFEKHVAESGGVLYIVEVAFGKRDFVVTQAGNPQHIQLRTHHELWLKERAINLGVARLTSNVPDWGWVCWPDPDGMFIRQDWCDEIKHALQHYPIVQCWSQLTDVTVDYEIQAQRRSFMDVQMFGIPAVEPGYTPSASRFGSPGFAWACRREAWEAMAGLIDFCILGAGDWYQANIFVGTLEKALEKRSDLTGPFVRKLRDYDEHFRRGRWEGRSIVGNVGLVRGLVVHFWHGSRTLRKYGTRGKILSKHGFDPEKDLKPDASLLWALTDRCPEMRREIQDYFRERDEDSN